MRSFGRERDKTTCQWCGKELTQTGRGRPRKFCAPACKQRAYEQRHGVQGTDISPNAVIMSPEKANVLRDGLFELRCSAEDVLTAVSEGAEPEELRALCEEMVGLTRRLEELR